MEISSATVFKIFPAQGVTSRNVSPSNNNNSSPATNISRIDLHGLDLFSGPTHISIHQFFRCCPSSEFDALTIRLKDSLAQALALYPPVAGTIRVDEQDGGKLYIEMSPSICSGTPFFVDRRDTPFLKDSDSVSPRSQFFLPTPASVLEVKLSQFSCGTIALASSMHHQVTDLHGFVTFLQIWAEISRGNTIDLSKLPSVWSRSPGRFFQRTDDVEGATSACPPPFAVLDAAPNSMPSFPPAAVTLWNFTVDNIKQLKRDLRTASDASSTADVEDSSISSNDALSALLWGAVARARASSNIDRVVSVSHDPESEILAMAADGRLRSPQFDLANKYFGNLNTLFATKARRADLLTTHSCVGTWRVALGIRKAVSEQLSAEAISEKIRFFEDPKNVVPPGRIYFKADVIGTNWCQARLESSKFDFGWGKPFAATSGTGHLPAGFFRMLQGENNADVLVTLTVEKGALGALKEDLLLQKYATLVDA